MFRRSWVQFPAESPWIFFHSLSNAYIKFVPAYICSCLHIVTISHSVISDNCKLIIISRRTNQSNYESIRGESNILKTNFHIRTRVHWRARSLRIEARGIFPGAEVVRGRDWRWGNQDGKQPQQTFLPQVAPCMLKAAFS